MIKNQRKKVKIKVKVKNKYIYLIKKIMLVDFQIQLLFLKNSNTCFIINLIIIYLYKV